MYYNDKYYKSQKELNILYNLLSYQIFLITSIIY